MKRLKKLIWLNCFSLIFFLVVACETPHGPSSYQYVYVAEVEKSGDVFLVTIPSNDYIHPFHWEVFIRIHSDRVTPDCHIRAITMVSMKPTSHAN